MKINPNAPETNFPQSVIIIDNSCGHGFGIGTTVTLTDFYMEYKSRLYYHAKSLRGNIFLITDKDYSLIVDSELNRTEADNGTNGN